MPAVLGEVVHRAWSPGTRKGLTLPVFQVSEQEKVIELERSILHTGNSYFRRLPITLLLFQPLLIKILTMVYGTYEFLFRKTGFKVLNVFCFHFLTITAFGNPFLCQNIILRIIHFTGVLS